MSERSEVRTFPARAFPADSLATNGDSMLAHVIPVRRAARDIFTRSAVMLVMTPLVPSHVLPVELIRSLFDLTSAEARVARSLATGATVQDIARQGQVSPNTVRTQVRSVLSKTGFARQSEVVAMLTGIWTPRPADEV
jgi:DNA-binding CsgD family transcriptional regulator